MRRGEKNMKKMKKVLAMLLSFIMMMSMAMTTFAAPGTKAGSTGSITINGTKAKGSVEAYRLFKLDNVDYTLETVFEGFFKETYPEMSKFTGTKLANAAIDKVTTIQNGNASTKVDFSKKVLTWVKGKEKTEESKFHEVKTTVAAVKDSTTLSNLPYGFYMVYAKGATSELATKNEKTPAIMVNISETTQTVNLKSEYPTVDKTIIPPITDTDDVTPDGNGNLNIGLDNSWEGNHEMGLDSVVEPSNAGDFQVGDVVSFKLTAKVPDMTGFSAYTFKFHDTLSKGLTFQAIQKVTVGGKVKKPVLAGKETDDTYTVKLDTKSIPGETKLTVTMNKFLESYRNHVGETIEVIYKAVVNKDAVVGMDPNTNKAEVEFSNDPNKDTTEKSETDVVDVHTFGFDVFKFYKEGVSATENPLAGAQFELYEDSNCLNKIKLTKQEDGKTWSVSENQINGQDDMIETPTEGKVTIKGLAAGTYYLKEIKAPDGYNKLKQPIEITIIPTYSKDHGKLTQFTVDYTLEGKKADSQVITDKNSVATIKVENKKGTLLPETGGMGTVIFTVVAIVLILGVAASFVFSRRRDRR